MELENEMHRLAKFLGAWEGDDLDYIMSLDKDFQNREAQIIIETASDLTVNFLCKCGFSKSAPLCEVGMGAPAELGVATCPQCSCSFDMDVLYLKEL